MKCPECGGKINERQMTCEKCGLVIEDNLEFEYFPSFEQMYPFCPGKFNEYERLVEEIGMQLGLPYEVRLDAIRILHKVKKAGCFQIGRRRRVWVSTAITIASLEKNYPLNLERLLKLTKTNQESLLRTVSIFAILTTSEYTDLVRRSKLSLTKEDTKIMKCLREKRKI
jgi:transcription initiation factor TFIIIB Brf1 subunit/transcription initiation factor TFIIB